MKEHLYIGEYSSPLGKIVLSATADALTGLWFEGQKYFPEFDGSPIREDSPVITLAKKWLDIYFSGKEPGFDVPVCFKGTEFQKTVWNCLLKIPYGKTVTYGDIAKDINCKSARAVGGAVGKNPISIIVPCHRVLGVGNSLTGYAGGLERKIYLLEIEKSTFAR